MSCFIINRFYLVTHSYLVYSYLWLQYKPLCLQRGFLYFVVAIVNHVCKFYCSFSVILVGWGKWWWWEKCKIDLKIYTYYIICLRNVMVHTSTSKVVFVDKRWYDTKALPCLFHVGFNSKDAVSNTKGYSRIWRPLDISEIHISFDSSTILEFVTVFL